MEKNKPMRTLFVDIGNVLLTNGWDHQERQHAAKVFHLDGSVLEKRHEECADLFEKGYLTLQDYLSRVVFYEERLFTPQQFEDFMFAQSQPFPQMLEFIEKLKVDYKLTVIAASNESRELNEYRIRKFKLGQTIDFFISSCFVHVRKPDPSFFRLLLDLTQTPASSSLFLDDRETNVQAAQSLGIQAILHQDLNSTRTRCLKILNTETRYPYKP